MMQLSQHDKIVLEKLTGVGWISQHQLQTSRQTMNKLVRAKLVERKIVNDRVRYLPESGARYRLSQN
ncbi:hypothetical protein [Cellvibrio sp. UBA7671]|uniref:hypothetical protein n=1 Tax=Cellvibrio sp. UBA7671 TaxID=1946312 RepID=UPI002F3516AE